MSIILLYVLAVLLILAILILLRDGKVNRDISEELKSIRASVASANLDVSKIYSKLGSVDLDRQMLKSYVESSSKQMQEWSDTRSRAFQKEFDFTVQMMKDLDRRFKDLEYEALKPKTMNIHAPKPIPIIVGFRGVRSKQALEKEVIGQVKKKLARMDA